MATLQDKQRLKSIRRRIKRRREAYPYLSCEMAKKMNISGPYYSQLENGSRNLSALHIIQITRILQTDLV